MRKSKLDSKIKESLKRQRQKEIIGFKKLRDTKRELGEAITKDDYHPSGHIRHGK